MVSPSESQAPVYCQMAKYSQDVLCLHSHAYLGFHPSFWGRLEDLLALRTSCLGCILKSLAKAFLILCIYIYIYILYICLYIFVSDNSLFVRCPPASEKRRLPSSNDCPDCPSAASWQACDMQIWQVRKNVIKKVLRQVQIAEISGDRTWQRVKLCQVSGSNKKQTNALLTKVVVSGDWIGCCTLSWAWKQALISCLACSWQWQWTTWSRPLYSGQMTWG